MNKDFQKAKQIYDSVKIPSQLSYEIDKPFQAESKKSSIWIRRTLQVCSSLCVACFLFAVLVNVNPTFAKSMENIPVLSNIVKWLQIREIHEENELDVIDAQIPNIANTGNSDFEQKINNKINEKIEEILQVAREDAQEAKNTLMKYDENHVFEPIRINISYEIKCQENEILSFIITQTQSDNMHANVHVQKFMYNIDLKQNKELTLEDLLGEDYQNIVNQQIQSQMEEIEEKGEGDFFEPEDFPYLEHGGWFEGITQDQKFYINEKGNVVIVFDRYEIAPGYMGMPEFEIK